jgi:sodium/bile acid cotransporter 7
MRLILLVMICLPLAAHAEPLDDAAKLRLVQRMYRGYTEKDLLGVPVLTVGQTLALLRKKKDRVVLVDVREPREQRVSMIAGAVPASRFLERRPKKGQIVVAYCTIGYRSGMLVKKLRQQGVEAYNMSGSLLAWVHAGQPLQSGGRRTRRLHVYGKKWDLAPRRIETTW